MSYLLEALGGALGLIFSADADVLQAVWASLRFSLASTLLASVVGIPAGVALAVVPFRGRRLLVTLTNTLLALPTVVVGLMIYGLLCRQGPAGELGLLFTPWAIILGQTVLIVPIVTALTRGAVAAVDPTIRATALTLGASTTTTVGLVLREARGGVLVAVGTAFGRVIGEVGVSMMLGGNIAGFTRTITTVIALETRKGAFTLALALGIILLTVAFALNLAVSAWAGEDP